MNRSNKSFSADNYIITEIYGKSETSFEFIIREPKTKSLIFVTVDGIGKYTIRHTLTSKNTVKWIKNVLKTETLIYKEGTHITRFSQLIDNDIPSDIKDAICRLKQLNDSATVDSIVSAFYILWGGYINVSIDTYLGIERHNGIFKIPGYNIINIKNNSSIYHESYAFLVPSEEYIKIYNDPTIDVNKLSSISIDKILECIAYDDSHIINKLNGEISSLNSNLHNLVKAKLILEKNKEI